MNLLLLCQYSFILPCTGPQKCDRLVWLPVKFAIERNPKNSLTTGLFIPKQYQSLFFYDNRDLKISRSKKSGQYFRDKFHGHFARHFESHRRETWRHTGRRTEPPISLETPSLSPPPGCFLFISNFMKSSTVYAPSLFTFVRFETMIWPSIRFDISLQNFKESVQKNI